MAGVSDLLWRLARLKFAEGWGIHAAKGVACFRNHLRNKKLRQKTGHAILVLQLQRPSRVSRLLSIACGGKVQTVTQTRWSDSLCNIQATEHRCHSQLPPDRTARPPRGRRAHPGPRQRRPVIAGRDAAAEADRVQATVGRCERGPGSPSRKRRDRGPIACAPGCRAAIWFLSPYHLVSRLPLIV
jgi:hypothetical protein